MSTAMTVSCRQRDPLARLEAEYSGSTEAIARAQTNQSEYRAVRDIAPAINELSEDARWLATHCPRYVAGLWPRRGTKNRLICFGGLSLAAKIRQRASRCSEPRARAAAQESAEAFIRRYGLKDEAVLIDDWLFPVIEPDESGEGYCERVVDQMRRAGVTAVEINGARHALASSQSGIAQ